MCDDVDAVSRSPSVKAEEASMQEPGAEPFAGGLLEVAKDAVNAADVHARMFAGDVVRATPALLVGVEPDLVLGGGMGHCGERSIPVRLVVGARAARPELFVHLRGRATPHAARRKR
jgi:hypothetical protein